jgi:hypothetical protein
MSPEQFKKERAASHEANDRHSALATCHSLVSAIGHELAPVSNGEWRVPNPVPSSGAVELKIKEVS